jgi:hypothetical protein
MLLRLQKIPKEHERFEAAGNRIVECVRRQRASWIGGKRIQAD